MIIPAPVFYFAGVCIAALLEFYCPISVFPAGRGLWLISAALTISSCLFMLWALVVMLVEKTSPNPYLETRKIVFHGPYQYSRNPMYLGMNGFFLALAFFVNSLWFFLLLFPVSALLKRYIIQREESYLELRFGQQYRDYKNRVRRWL